MTEKCTIQYIFSSEPVSSKYDVIAMHNKYMIALECKTEPVSSASDVNKMNNKCTIT